MKILEVSDSFTRPNDTTAYASGDLVANNTTAGSVTPMTFRLGYGQSIQIKQVRLLIAGITVNTNAKFLLHLYNTSPTVTNGDNGAWLSTSSGYLGNVAIDATLSTFSDNTVGIGTPVFTSVGVPWVAVGDTNWKLYGLLSATAAYTPGAQKIFTASLIGECYV